MPLNPHLTLVFLAIRPKEIQMEPYILVASLASTFFAIFFALLFFDNWVDYCNHEASLNPNFNRENRERILREESIARSFPRLFVAMEFTNRGKFLKTQKIIGKYLIMAGREHYLPNEFLAIIELKAILATSIVCFMLKTTGITGNFMTGIMGIAIFTSVLVYHLQSLKQQATERTELISYRLPYAVDQIALILGAGGHFQESVQFVLREMENHPLAHELSLVHRGIRLGMNRHEMLREMASRLNMPMMSELVTTIIQGENSGTPLSDIFQTQAEQMRLKRSQMIEQFAAKMGVRMTGPGMLSMISCLIIITAIFAIWMLKTIHSDGGFMSV